MFGGLIADEVFGLRRPLYTSAARAAVCSSVRRERFVFPLTVYNPARSWHLELEVGIMRYRIESNRSGSPEQRMITTAERDYIKD